MGSSFARWAVTAGWLGALTLGLVGCGEDQQPTRARALWGRLQAEQYRGWLRAPGFEQRRPSRAPHGDQVDIFVNDVVAGDLASPRALAEWSDGAAIIKDGYDGSDLRFVAAMVKEGGEWFWAEYDGDGDTLFSGAPDICTGCHQIGDDFVRTFFLPLPALEQP